MKVDLSAARSSELVNSSNKLGAVAGFWHVLIAPFAFLTSLLNNNVGVYDSQNNGNWCNLGFIVGLMIAFGGNQGAGRQVHRSKDDA